MNIKNIPNILTVFRILIIPILVMSFYIDGFVSNLVAASLFMIASITDFFDGYFQCMSIEFLVLMNVSAMKMLLIVVAVGGKRQLTA
jgi:hypothetical protein